MSFEYVEVATYTYDAWGEKLHILDSDGNEITSSSNIAIINPLRYRGYYYDTETKFYYLQSRYYDPANHRFINADSYASTDFTDAIACNMFAYCGNSPVLGYDPSGCRPSWERRYGDGLVEYTDTGTGRYVSYDIPLYYSTDSDPSGFNCVAFSLGVKFWLNVGDISGKEFTSMDISTVSSVFISDVKALGWDIHEVDFSYRLHEGEYLVALRTGIEDYHFMLCNNGIWMQKNGTLPPAEVGIGNPALWDWNKPANVLRHTDSGRYEALVFGYYENYYDSKTVFFAIKPR